MEITIYKSITILRDEENLTEEKYNELAKRLKLYSFETLKFLFGKDTLKEVVDVVINEEYNIKEIV